MTGTDDLKIIEGVIQSYLDGLYEGDASKIASVFHPTSALTSVTSDGELDVTPRDKWLDKVRARLSPMQPGLPLGGGGQPDQLHHQEARRTRGAAFPPSIGGSSTTSISLCLPRVRSPSLRNYPGYNNRPADFSEQCNEHDIITPTPSWCVHAAGEHSHRRLALSRRVAGHEFQLRAPETLHPGAGAGEVRCLLHGRPHGRAQHAARCAQAQPHGDLIRAVHAVVGPVPGDRTHRLGRHRLDHFRRALSHRAPLRLARSYFRRPRWLEYRHHFQSGRRPQF